MLKKNFNISDQIDIKEINKIYDNNFEKIIYEFANLEIDWLYNAYNQYKDIDKYLILVNLIYKSLATYNKYFFKLSFKEFYNNPNTEIEKINIVDLARELEISKETTRRKLNELSKDGVIKRNLKKIKITNLTSNPKLEKNIYNLSKLINIFSKNLSGNQFYKNISIKEIEKKILTNYTQYWFIFFNFQIAYILRWKKLYKSSEAFYIYAFCALNEIYNSKKISKINNDRKILNLDKFQKNLINIQKKTKGLNSTTISELSGIPRATVIRKIKYLLKNDFLRKNKKNNLFSLNNDQNSKSFKLQGKMFKENQKELRNFIKDILNLIQN